MKTASRYLLRAALLGLAVTAGRGTQATAQAVATNSYPAYVPADAEFMTGMIGHHAQAVLIAGWAPSHGASPAILNLCERIVAGQTDEIELMQVWLADHNEPVPDPLHQKDGMAGMNHDMAGMDHGTMPGMLNAEQLAQLDAARGPEYDRLLLTYMIQHHKGAIVMVDKLFATQGAGEEERSFRFASNVYADQTTEIDRMQKMLAALPGTASTK